MSEPVATSAAPANEDAKPEVRRDELTTPIIDNTNHVCKWCTWKHFFLYELACQFTTPVCTRQPEIAVTIGTFYGKLLPHNLCAYVF
jgi:hypothetical protein